jgi:Protein of unknown function (DUF3298)/HNH endonuclease
VNDRPQIPADLRRRILVEAGHRCAIHSCRHPEVDLHHIVPWEQCKRHEYDNLIALCPNCHRRADSQEIDRSSLRMYKARLVASLGLNDPLIVASQTSVPNVVGASRREWQTETIHETQTEYPSYEAELEFPKFTGISQDLNDLTVLERSNAIRRLNELRATKLLISSFDNDPMAKLPGTVTSSYEISCFTEEIVSIRYSIFQFSPGAAHPNHLTAVTNVQMGPLISLNFTDLFDSMQPYLKNISRFCVTSLAEQKELTAPSEWIMRGAGPDPKNFSRFNITPVGLMITFDEYQVDCYAAGSSQVHVAHSVFSQYLNRKCLANRVWESANV